MPFKSVAQEHYLFANKPDLANKWRMEHPSQKFNTLPKKVGSTMPQAPKAPKFSPWQKLAK